MPLHSLRRAGIIYGSLSGCQGKGDLAVCGPQNGIPYSPPCYYLSFRLSVTRLGENDLDLDSKARPRVFCVDLSVMGGLLNTHGWFLLGCNLY